MPVPGGAAAKQNASTSTSSAWSRLVHLTQNATKRPRGEHVKPRTHSDLPSDQTLNAPQVTRPAKKRRFTEPPSLSPSPSSTPATSARPRRSSPTRDERVNKETRREPSSEPKTSACNQDCVDNRSCLGNKSPSHRSESNSSLPNENLSSAATLASSLAEGTHLRTCAKVQGAVRRRRASTSSMTELKRKEDDQARGDSEDAGFVTASESRCEVAVHDVACEYVRRSDESPGSDEAGIGNGNPQPASSVGAHAAFGTKRTSRNANTAPFESTPGVQHDRGHCRSDTGEAGVTAVLSSASPPVMASLQEARQDRLSRSSQPGPQTTEPEPDRETAPSNSPSSSSPDSKSKASSDENDGSQPPPPLPTRRTKRRLTLHDTHHPSHKKRKTAPPQKKKATVQTTLNLAIGGSAGMRECKVCDTVYNPFHAEDIKVHAKRHAGILRRKTVG